MQVEWVYGQWLEHKTVKLVVECVVVWGETVRLPQAPLLVLKTGSHLAVVQEQKETMGSQDKYW